MTTLFRVHGPFPIPTYAGKAAKIINSAGIKTFWGRHPALAAARGCYVFGIRNKSLKPSYVGLARKSFKGEVFTADKLAKYARELADYKKCMPVFFFIVAPTKKGKPNGKHIGQLETFLIELALYVNPNLLNIKGTKQEDWGIAGVHRGGKGKPSYAAKELKRMFRR